MLGLAKATAATEKRGYKSRQASEQRSRRRNSRDRRRRAKGERPASAHSVMRTFTARGLPVFWAVAYIRPRPMKASGATFRGRVPSPNCRPVCCTLARQFGDKGTLADSKG
jgi:hypothetical protein